MHLWDDVTPQRCVLCRHPESVERNDVPHPLDLVDDSICVRHVGSVRRGGLTAVSHHSVHLCLYFIFKTNLVY